MSIFPDRFRVEMFHEGSFGGHHGSTVNPDQRSCSQSIFTHVTNVPVGPFLYFYVSEDCVNAK